MTVPESSVVFSAVWVAPMTTVRRTPGSGLPVLRATTRKSSVRPAGGILLVFGGAAGAGAWAAVALSATLAALPRAARIRVPPASKAAPNTVRAMNCLPRTSPAKITAEVAATVPAALATVRSRHAVATVAFRRPEVMNDSGGDSSQLVREKVAAGANPRRASRPRRRSRARSSRPRSTPSFHRSCRAAASWVSPSR